MLEFALPRGGFGSGERWERGEQSGELRASSSGGGGADLGDGAAPPEEEECFPAISDPVDAIGEVTGGLGQRNTLGGHKNLIVRFCDYHIVPLVSKVDPTSLASLSGGPERAPRKTRRARPRTLEFDLGFESASRRRARTARPKAEAVEPVTRSEPEPAAPEPEPEVIREAPAFRSGSRIRQNPFVEETQSAEPIGTEPEIKEPRMNPIQPAPLNVKKTIERQSREQNAVSHVLNGVAIAFLCGIILVASLSGLGGYVLYKQLQNQSASLALLESNTQERLAELEGRLAAKNRELAEAQREANLRVTTLQGNFDQYRSQTTQSISLLTSANARLERRLAEYRQELVRHEQLLSYNVPTDRRTNR